MIIFKRYDDRLPGSGVWVFIERNLGPLLYLVFFLWAD